MKRLYIATSSRTRAGAPPDLYGIVESGKGYMGCLVLEYLEGCVRVSASGDKRAMPLSARWSGWFHAVAGSLGVSHCAAVRMCNRDYYLQVGRRTRHFLEGRRECPHWLPHLCEEFEELVAELSAPPLTLVHGEFYPKNLLIGGGVICPVDWESTAIAAAEIDLACLTDLWPANVARECEAEYARARWPSRAPAGFLRRLDIARLYLHFRWMGDSSGFLVGDALRQRPEELRAVGVRIGAIH